MVLRITTAAHVRTDPPNRAPLRYFCRFEEKFCKHAATALTHQPTSKIWLAQSYEVLYNSEVVLGTWRTQTKRTRAPCSLDPRSELWGISPARKNKLVHIIHILQYPVFTFPLDRYSRVVGTLLYLFISS